MKMKTGLGLLLGLAGACAACCALPLLAAAVGGAGLLDRPDRPCVEARDIAARHLATVRHQLAELRALEHSMAGIVGGCEAACAGGPAQDCSILEDLGSAQPAAAAASGGPLSSTTLPSGSLR